MAISGRRRWAIAVLVGSLAVAAVGAASVRAEPSPDLPPIGADELLASSFAALARPFTISGDVETRVDLGIPQVPSSVSGGSGGGLMGAVSILTGDQRYKLWRSTDGVRVAHLLAFSEQDLVVSPSDAWFWDSSDMTAVHLASPGMGLAARASGAAALRGGDLLDFARRALQAVAPYADVSVAPVSIVAGRPTYPLVLTPTSTLTLVGRIVVSIDAGSRLPLRLQVFPRTGAAAIEAGFTSVSFGSIDPAMFAFTPPPGATVRQAADVLEQASTSDGTPSITDRRVFGRGFDLRVALRLDGPSPEGLDTFLPYAGPLLSAVSIDRDGRTWILVGPVSVATLEQDAPSLP